jgi:hypothetical protein
VIDELLRIEGLGNLPVRPDRDGAARVDGGASAQQQHGDVLRGGVAAEALAQLVAVESRHADVRDDEIGRRLLRACERILAVGHRGQGHVLEGKGHGDRLLDGDGVVSEQNRTGHRCAVLLPSALAGDNL